MFQIALVRFCLACCLAIAAPVARGQVNIVAYEADAFPEGSGWERSTFCTPERWIEEGWLIQHVDPGECDDPPSGDRESYIRLVGDVFGGTPAFFVEWRVQVDGDRSEIPWCAPACLAMSGQTPAFYHFSMARDQVKFIRDADLGLILFVDIAPDVPHTYRLELYELDGEPRYEWYIDTELISSGVSDAPFPNDIAEMAWAGRSAHLKNTIMWDYLRYGVTQQDASGDYDSDGDVDSDDLYFFKDYFSGADAEALPGGRFADFDFDGDVDCDDWEAFKDAWTGPADPPFFPPCFAPPIPIPAVTDCGLLTMTVLMLTAMAITLRRRRA